MHNKVYVLDTAELDDETLFDRWLGKMTSRRRQKIAAFRFDKDKRLCLGAGILLAAAVQGGEKEPEYLVSEHGKPYFEDGRICFNLSHSGTLAVCAVSDREVGACSHKSEGDCGSPHRGSFFAYPLCIPARRGAEDIRL